MIGRLPHLLMGGAVTLALTLGVAYLSFWPAWRSLPEDTALLRLSFTHSGNREASCRDRTEEELAALPANMRQRRICDRKRPPVYVELDLDGQTVIARELPPSGLAGSGPSRVYQRFSIPAGAHDITVRLRDRPTNEGFDYTATTHVTLAPGQSFVVDFNAEAGGFTFH